MPRRVPRSPQGRSRCPPTVQFAEVARATTSPLGQAVPAQPTSVRRGDVVLSQDPHRLGVLHAAVALSNATAATIDPQGVVVCTPIAWNLVRAIRRV